MANLVSWDLFKSTVEGRQSPVSCVVEDSKLMLSAYPVKTGEGYNLKLLADFLRSDNELPDEIRVWLAELLDPESASYPFRLQMVGPNGRPKKADGGHWDAAQHYREIVSQGKSAKEAYYTIKQHYGISRNTVRAALKSLAEAEAIETDHPA